MTEDEPKKQKQDEIPFEKRAMEIILRILVIVAMTYFFLLIVVL